MVIQCTLARRFEVDPTSSEARAREAMMRWNEVRWKVKNERWIITFHLVDPPECEHALANNTQRCVVAAVLEESMNAEINKQCPKVATKKNDSHIWAPTKKHNAHVLRRRMQAVCM